MDNFVLLEIAEGRHFSIFVLIDINVYNLTKSDDNIIINHQTYNITIITKQRNKGILL